MNKNKKKSIIKLCVKEDMKEEGVRYASKVNNTSNNRNKKAIKNVK